MFDGTVAGGAGRAGPRKADAAKLGLGANGVAPGPTFPKRRLLQLIKIVHPDRVGGHLAGHGEGQGVER